MTAAYRLKGVGWFGACTAVVLGFYLVSLQVAAERKKLEGLNSSIAATQREIRALETEFDTRSNLAQLERWNGDTLALTAPRPTQFLRDAAEFAATDPRGPLAMGGAEVKTAALVVPSLPAATPALAIAVSAPAVPPAVAPTVRVAAVPATAPVVALMAHARATARASIAKVAFRAAFDPDRGGERVAAARPASLLRARPEVAMLDHKLLSDTTLGDLLARARGEKARGR